VFSDIKTLNTEYKLDLKFLPQIGIDIAFSVCSFTIEIVAKHGQALVLGQGVDLALVAQFWFSGQGRNRFGTVGLADEAMA